MKKNLRKMISYYKPYIAVFITDMVLAIMSALIALMIPLVVRYITSSVIHMDTEKALNHILMLGIGMAVLVVVQAFCNYYIANYGHVMGAKIEYDMRKEIFSHYQKLSFSIYDDENTGQLMSSITTDLYDISE